MFAPGQPDHGRGQPVQTAHGGVGGVDAGRERAGRDLDPLVDEKTDVLGLGTLRAPGIGRGQRGGHVVVHPCGGSGPEQRLAVGHEVAGRAFEAQHEIVRGGLAQQAGVDEVLV